MASTRGSLLVSAATALLLSLNLLFFSSFPMVSSSTVSPLDSCPSDVLKFGACGGLLSNLLGISFGTLPNSPCCGLLGDLVGLEAGVCLCTALKGNVLGFNLNVPIAFNLLINYCGTGVPAGFLCA